MAYHQFQYYRQHIILHTPLYPEDIKQAHLRDRLTLKHLLPVGLNPVTWSNWIKRLTRPSRYNRDRALLRRPGHRLSRPRTPEDYQFSVAIGTGLPRKPRKFTNRPKTTDAQRAQQTQLRREIHEAIQRLRQKMQEHRIFS